MGHLNHLVFQFPYHGSNTQTLPDQCIRSKFIIYTYTITKNTIQTNIIFIKNTNYYIYIKHKLIKFYINPNL